MSDNKWHTRFMDVARLVSTWSKDPKKKVGCVLIDEYNNIIATGYNGTPRGFDDYSYCNRLEVTIHAEVNALLQAKHAPITAYVYPVMPCSHCMAALSQAGVQRVVSPKWCSDKWRPDLVREICDVNQIEVLIRDK